MNNNSLRVRVYNVRFGDAILISLPDASPTGAEEMSHILIDVGNSLGTEGGVDTVFQPVLDDVLSELGGRPLDLYIMTHEHMDHVQGLLYRDEKSKPGSNLKDRLDARYAWLTASAAPDYYSTHPAAAKKLDEVRGFLDGMRQYLAAAPEEETEWIRALMAINNPRSTEDCVEYLRNLASDTRYVYRGLDPTGKHPFHETRFEIWAPEEDTSIYYGRFQPIAFGLAPTGGEKDRPVPTRPNPPPGVDAGAFYNLVELRRRGYADNLLAIDKAANNTSIVLCIEWRGWRLLFSGDAERRSWLEMDKRKQPAPVDFLKVSHHGSETGLPPSDLLDKILPKDGKTRYAALSAYPDPDKLDAGLQKWVYKDVPDRETLKELKRRAKLRRTAEAPDGGYLDYIFEGGSRKVTVTTSNRRRAQILRKSAR